MVLFFGDTCQLDKSSHVSQKMFWNDHPRRDDTEVTKYLHALDALSQKTNSTTIRSLISAILGDSLCIFIH